MIEIIKRAKMEFTGIVKLSERFAFFGFQFEILRRQRNQITALRVIPPTKPAGEEPLAASVPAKPQPG